MRAVWRKIHSAWASGGTVRSGRFFVLKYAKMTAPDHKLAATEPLVDSIVLARSVMEAEARAIQAAALRINAELASAVDMVLNHRGKLIVTGMGKSGHIGRKLAATLQSSG